MHLQSLLAFSWEYSTESGGELPISAGTLAIIVIAFWLIGGFIMMKVAQNAGAENTWMAFIPILNVILMCHAGGKSGWWFLLFCIPIVNIIAAFIIWIGIAENCGRPGWWGAVICIVPIVNLILLLILAFGTPPQRASYPAY
jgi:hypothetical protein